MKNLVFCKNEANYSPTCFVASALLSTTGGKGFEITALGMGCWAIGGPMNMQGMPLGWGNVDDEESKRALRKAFYMGVNFFDTADVYGLGHSEKLLGEVFSVKRGEQHAGVEEKTSIFPPY